MEALVKLGIIIDKLKLNIEREIKNIRIEQSRLSPKYFDYSRYENIIEDLMVLDLKRADHITAKVFFDNLIVIYCGFFLKFGFIPNIN